jgi:Tfp pilus assembly protein PilF
MKRRDFLISSLPLIMGLFAAGCSGGKSDPQAEDSREIHDADQGDTLGYAYKGKKEEALQIAQRLQEDVEKGHSSGDLLASVYAALGDADEFFKWAREAVRLRHWELYVLKNHDKAFPKLSSDNRWAELLAEAGLKQS